MFTSSHCARLRDPESCFSCVQAHVTGMDTEHTLPAVAELDSPAARRRALNEIDPMPISYFGAGKTFFAGVINA